MVIPLCESTLLRTSAEDKRWIMWMMQIAGMFVHHVIPDEMRTDLFPETAITSAEDKQWRYYCCCRERCAFGVVIDDGSTIHVSGVASAMLRQSTHEHGFP
jgi:hypothetical protein